MPLFDDDQDGFWATRLGMTPDDWQAARTQAADAAGQAYDADTRAMATGADAQPSDGAGVNKFQTAYQGQMARQMAQGTAQPAEPPPMSISQGGLDLLKSAEGFKDHVYPDSSGHPTIGWGHKLTNGEQFPTRISADESRRLLRADLAPAEAAVRRHVAVPLNQNQYDALTSFAFNVGQGNFRSSTVVRKLNEGDYAGAADHLLDWDKKKMKDGSYVPEQGRINRRRAERSWFLKSPAP